MSDATINFLSRIIRTIPAAMREVEFDRYAGAVAETAAALGVSSLTWEEAIEVARDLWDAGCCGTGPHPVAAGLDAAATAAGACQRACAGAIVGGPGPTADEGDAFAAAFPV